MLAEAPWDRIEKLRAFADEREVPMVRLAIGWLAAQPAVASVICGATGPEQIRSNARAGDWAPTLADLDLVNEICAPGRR
jgi:aryl-alcohol dehydrogenase-like predicted oxidoreductase